MSTKVVLEVARLSYNNLYKAVQFPGQPDAPFNYDATFYVEKGSENDKRIRAAIKKEAAEEWKTKAQSVIDSIENNSNKNAYTDGDKKGQEASEGMMVLASKRKQSAGRPLVVDRNKAPLNESDGKPYSGCYVNATVEIWAQSGKHQGIRCALLGVQFVKDGDSFASGSKASEEDFDDLGTDETAEEAIA
jgi:hypothetical protein